MQQALYEKFRVPAEVLSPALDPAFALHAERQQYHSSEILAAMQRHIGSHTWRLLGVTEFDLYIPILTFVFGEAQLGGSGAVVSYHRLKQEFYGLPADLDLLANRLLIEAVHELGHTLRLSHCRDSTAAPWRLRTRWSGSTSRTAASVKIAWRGCCRPRDCILDKPEDDRPGA